MAETIDYIGADDLIFTNNLNEGIHSGGFNVQSIMMKAGMSPIMTMNTDQLVGGGSNNVSDLFKNLVVPNWAISYHDRMMGGEYKDHDPDSDSDEESDIDDDIHDKLVNLARQNESEIRKKNVNKKRFTKKNKANQTTSNANQTTSKKNKTKKQKE